MTEGVHQGNAREREGGRDGGRVREMVEHDQCSHAELGGGPAEAVDAGKAEERRDPPTDGKQETERRWVRLYKIVWSATHRTACGSCFSIGKTEREESEQRAWRECGVWRECEGSVKGVWRERAARVEGERSSTATSFRVQRSGVRAQGFRTRI
eukprot:82539-Rhodomonas_salina.2